MRSEPILSIELIPEKLWGQSLAKQYRERWDELRFPAYQNAGHQCEICGGTGTRESVRNPGGLECHEVWEYSFNGTRGTQRLVGLIALCPDCHHCKHMGRSFNMMPPGEFRRLQRHFMRVNRMRETEFDEYSARIKETWQDRNSFTWSQDLTAFLNTNDEWVTVPSSH